MPMMKHFLIFGTHPRISLAEYRALRPKLVAPITVGHAAIVDDEDWDGEALMQTLGGTVKLGEILLSKPSEECDASSIIGIIRDSAIKQEVRGERREARDQQSNNQAIQQSSDISAIDFGMTLYGGSERLQKLFKKVPIAIKHALKDEGIRSRWVTGEGNAPLSPAAVAKLKMTEKGTDIVCIVIAGIAYVGRTTHVQDADAWSLRDYGRPMRDDREGMLPPKLARMMTNIAQVKKGMTILDPFCGNGAVLMEAALSTRAGMILGSDIEERQTYSCEQNLSWLIDERVLAEKDVERFKMFPCDVRRIADHLEPNSVDIVITEGTLGPPLRGSESKHIIDRNAREVASLWAEALQALHPLLRSNARLVIIWPSYKTDGGIARVGLDEEVARLGYRVVNPLEGWDNSGNPLVYHRPGQFVARRIVVLQKK
jgi:tRNA G10  N-methylase Trm11